MNKGSIQRKSQNASRVWVLVFVATILLILYQYFVTQNMIPFYIDEKVYARLAYSILNGHLASSSSFYSIYIHYGFNVSDVSTPFGSTQTVEPWLDHPPLFATLLVPIIAADLSPRLLPIVLAGLITIEISVLLRRQIRLAILSAVTWLLYVIFSPILAMDFLDSGVSFFLILTILFSNEHYHTNSKKYIYAAAIASALCAATKIFGLAAGLYLLFFILYLRLNKSGKIMTNERLISKILPIFVALVGSSVWFLYGFLVQSQLFLALLTANANRSILSAHNLNFLVFISTPIISASQISIGTLSPLLVIGWFGILYMFTVPKFRVLQIGLSSYLGFVIILGYAWFYTLIPFYPFFCIGIGSLCLDAISLVENGHRNARDI